MKKILDQIRGNKWLQLGLLVGYIALTSLSLILAQRSVAAFLLLLLSFLLLYYTKLPNWSKWAIGLAIMFFILPFSAMQGPAYQEYMDVATLVGIYVSMALGLNIVVGMAGLLDLGFVAFFAVGAYTYGIFATAQANNFMPFGTYPLSGNSFWIFIILGCFVAALFGVLLGIPVLRVKGDYLAIVTLGFGEIIRIVFNNMDQPVNITNGALGLSSIAPPKIFGIELLYSNQIYFVVLFILLFIIFAVRSLEHSKLGRSWKAVRENEIAAQAMGIPLVKTKLMAFAIGASFSGMMGVVFAAKQAFIDPTSFTLLQSINILVMVLLGGMGSVPGVILGAAVVTILNAQVLNELTMWFNSLSTAGIITLPDAMSPVKMQRFFFGALLILFALYRSKGLIPAKNVVYDKRKFLSEKGTKKRLQSVAAPKEDEHDHTGS
ncbi:branched-chain amino acid ABC transporter permease [Terribacillus saccharophilus]|uniref:Branched-chain amino acid ABC transporter permease n=1 Tax=Terribacillus saccharophilus TaxID=361277 RepID=A0ABX4GZP9_9BACI|nr:branched-chain amino acid ABC transporter permease [Terribacillus saccharophilus]PAD36245.1 branched-chain amino acid ABC transporter permease [Terribacillus saccharophilus]PAD96733.1 branched-chain amino acid ABC transporter permease [Terribacillus saccharophilus]PAE00309.1 branched-chain amino acid ABC transporter permease [Terribacillus saccharophilus]